MKGILNLNFMLIFVSCVLRFGYERGFSLDFSLDGEYYLGGVKKRRRRMRRERGNGRKRKGVGVRERNVLREFFTMTKRKRRR